MIGKDQSYKESKIKQPNGQQMNLEKWKKKTYVKTSIHLVKGLMVDLFLEFAWIKKTMLESYPDKPAGEVKLL